METKITIKNIPTGYQSIIRNGRHAIVGDEPTASKGTDLGFSPVELLLAAISMCKVATIRNVARRKGWEIGEVDAELSQVTTKGADGKLSTSVSSAVRIDGDITAEQKALLVEEADKCYVTRVVRGDWEFTESTLLEDNCTSCDMAA